MTGSRIKFEETQKRAEGGGAEDGPLRMYFHILEGEEAPRYIRAKEIEIDFCETDSTEKLWRAHERAMVKLNKNITTAGAKSGGSSKTEECDSGASNQTLLGLKAELAQRVLESCRMCERKCQKNRRRGELGRCGVIEPRIASEFLHHGEERELVPSYTVFFAGCTFNCVFCQNADISQDAQNGIEVEPQLMANMIEKRALSARNVNWVGGDPTPNLYYVLEVLNHCSAKLPQIWNSNMYMSQETMMLLDGVVDVYLSDFKYGNNKCAKRLSNADNYVEIMARNHMLARQECEMIIRHLAMPNHVECCTKPVLDWIARNMKNQRGGVKVNLMDQYRPEYKAGEHKDINRQIRAEEFESALRYAESLGLDLE